MTHGLFWYRWEERGWSQAQLATRAKVDQRTISRIELGENVNPTYATVARICRALRVDPQDVREFRC